MNDLCPPYPPMVVRNAPMGLLWRRALAQKTKLTSPGNLFPGMVRILVEYLLTPWQWMAITLLYKKLAQHLDGLPGGFPPTKRGVEIKILELLFSPEEATLALCLTLISEPAATIAFRAGRPRGETEIRLETMAAKGLIFRSKQPDKPPVYMAAQFVVGIWELQVGRLTPELVTLMNDYMPDLMDPQIWKKIPQMRTVPVGRSIDTTLEVMTYEQAEELVRAKRNFVVAPCICRKERQMQAERCDKPMDANQINGNRAILDPGRCIGCGLCVSTCPTKALSLARKPSPLQPHVPKDITSASLKLMWKRGKMGPANVISLFGRPFMDRYRSKHPGNRRS